MTAADDLQQERARRHQLRQQERERAGYEAERARRQYDAVEPENRLVARELETRWNARLRAPAELEGEYRREQSRGLSPLTEAEKVLLRSLVGDVPALWRAARRAAMASSRRWRRLLARTAKKPTNTSRKMSRVKRSSMSGLPCRRQAMSWSNRCDFSV